MHPQHRLLLDELRDHRRGAPSQSDAYLGTGHRRYGITVPVLRAIAKAWLKNHKDLAASEFIAILQSLYRGESLEEKLLASILLAANRPGRDAVRTSHLGSWLELLSGWAEIDSLCQSVFTAEEVLSGWREWRPFIRSLSRDRNINKRRASLVFLTGPTRNSNDPRLAAAAFEVIERLKPERDILITKAVSWLMRGIATHHRRAVAAYINENRQSLPAIAVRETARKIATGRK